MDDPKSHFCCFISILHIPDFGRRVYFLFHPRWDPSVTEPMAVVFQMWREESGFLEMFLAYYSQFEENVAGGKAYRDFLFDIICAHELSLK